MKPSPALTPADRQKRRMRRLRSTVVLVVALLLYGALVWPIRESITDDTYIHLVYAKHFRDGLGLVFNPGQPVYGTTSPLWSLGLGVLGKTGVDLLVLAHVLAFLFGAGSILVGARFLRRFLDAWVSEQGYGAGRAELAWACGVLAFATDAWLVRWSATGMETALATFLVTAGFSAYVGRRPWGNRVLVPATWWSGAALVRPEAMLLIALLLLRIALSGSTGSSKRARLGWALLPVAAFHGPWLLYAAGLYHSIVPATLAAKTAAGSGLTMFVDVIVKEVKSIAASRAVELVALVALGPMLITRFWVRRADHFVPLGFLFGLPLLYAVRGVPVLSRYLVPILPLVIAYAWGAFAWLAARERRRPALAASGLVAAGLVSIALGLYTYTRYVVPQALAFRSGVNVTLAGLGRWVKANTPPGTEVAIPDIGAFAYFADRPVLDLAGLVTPAITPLLRRYPYDDLVTNLRFEGVARPPYLIDRADIPERMLFQSPYAACLTPLRVGRVDQRGISHPEPAYYTLYRIDWVAFDRMEGSVRQAGLDFSPPPPWAAWESPLNVKLPKVPSNAASFICTGGPTRDSTWFRVVWGGDRDVLDTWRGTFVYDRVRTPDTTVTMRWSDCDLDTMRRAATALRILDLREPYPAMKHRTDGLITIGSPSFRHRLELEIDGTVRRFDWSDDLGGSMVPVDPEEWRTLIEFTRLLDRMIARHPAFRALPPRNGFYL